MQTIQLATALVAVIAAAAAFPGFAHHGSQSHVSQSLGGFHGGYEHGGHHEEAYHHPEYKFDYAVHDPHTGDVKSAHESRNGDSVKGSYTIADADGHVRTVEYTADKHTGFQAIVKKGGKVTLHGYGEQDEQNNADHAGHGASYSQEINHGYSHGGGHGGFDGGLSHGAAQGSFGHGY